MKTNLDHQFRNEYWLRQSGEGFDPRVFAACKGDDLQDGRSGRVVAEAAIDPAVAAKIRSMCNGSSFLIYNFFACSLNYLLGRYNGGRAPGIISPALPDLMRQGHLLCFYLHEDKSRTDFKSLFSAGKEKAIEAMEQSMALEEMAGIISAGSPLPLAVGLAIEAVTAACPENMVEICFSVDLSAGRPSIKATFDAVKYEVAILELLTQNYAHLLTGIVSWPYRILDEIEFRCDLERRVVAEGKRRLTDEVMADDSAQIAEKYRSVSRASMCIVDPMSREVPVGVRGELMITGPRQSKGENESYRTGYSALFLPNGAVRIIHPGTDNSDSPAVREIESGIIAIWRSILGTNRYGLEIGIEQDFFELGGHSLLLVKVANSYYKRFNVQLPVSKLFEHRTVAGQARLILSHEQEDTVVPVQAQLPDYPVSYAQQRLWIQSRFEDLHGAYNMSAVFEVGDDLDIRSLEQAAGEIISRHETLRTIFTENGDGELRQKIIAFENMGFKLNVRTFNDPGEEAQQYLNNALHGSFDLEKGPLIRVGMVKICENRPIFYYSMHHIVCDGWSMQILEKEFEENYAAFRNGGSPDRRPLKVQCKDITVWQRDRLKGEWMERLKEFWSNELAGELPVPDLPMIDKRPAVKTYSGARMEFQLDEAASISLLEFSQHHGGTPFMAVMSMVYSVLFKYTGDRDIILGSPLTGRDHGEMDDQIGFYVNTLPFRLRIDEQDDFETIFRKFKTVALGVIAHEAYPFDRIVDDLELERDLSRSPVFDIVVTFRSLSAGRRSGSTGLQLKDIYSLPGDGVFAKYDLTIAFEETNGRISFSITYNSDLFGPDLIDRLGRHLINLSRQITRRDAPISKIDLLDADERSTLLALGERKDVQSQPATNVIQLFAGRVKDCRHKAAVTFRSEVLTYGELDTRANRLANYLVSKGIGKNDIVGVLLDRGAEYIVSILGILKAGACYLPLDVHYPADRLNYLMADSGAKLLITRDDCYDTFSELFPPVEIDPEDLAYIIYTSGTTGNAKGVLVEHRNLERLLHNISCLFEISMEDVWTQTHSNSFDFSVWEIFGALVTGGTLVIVDELVAKDLDELANVLLAEKVTVLCQTPSSFNALTDCLRERKMQHLYLRYLIFGGEALRPDKLPWWATAFPAVRLINMYGITETTVHVTFKELGPDDMNSRNVSIGRPLPTMSCYILDKHGMLAPWGIPGELYVGGSGVARGYLNRDELTRQRFIENPFLKGDRLYRSGDKVQLTACGEMVYLGRLDQQVKIRGHRIEPGEIENIILDMESILNTVVVPLASDDQGDLQLVAFYVTRGETEESAIRAFLRQKLPGYMIPSRFIRVDAIPLTPSGKADRKMLGMLNRREGAAIRETAIPQNETEAQLLAIWKKLINRKWIGIYDNFFEIGGHSLKAMALLSEIHKTFNVKLKFEDIFQSATIHELSLAIMDRQCQAFTRIPAAEDAADYPLSSSQYRTWITIQAEQNSIVYNMPGAVDLTGELDIDVFLRSVKAVIERHEMLRTVFKENKSEEIRQYIIPVKDFVFAPDLIDLRQEADKPAAAESVLARLLGTKFDLENGPLLQMYLLQMDDDHFVLMYNFHHLIGDGWSMEILTRDLLVTYHDLFLGRASSLPVLAIQYKDYAVWQQENLRGAPMRQHAEYWREKMAGKIPVLDLSGGRMRPATKTFNGGTQVFDLDRELADAIRKFAREREGSLFMGLLALAKGILHLYCDQTDIIVGTPVAGREHIDLKDQIGYYINTLPLRTTISRETPYSVLFDLVKETVFGAFRHQSYPLEVLIDELDIKRDPSRSALFDILVSLSGPEYSTPLELENERIKLSPFRLPYETTKFDLAIKFIEIGGSIRFIIDFNSDIYEEKLIRQFGKHLINFAGQAMSDPEKKIKDIQLCNEEESSELLAICSRARMPIPENDTIVSVFERQAEQAPAGPALQFQDRVYSYGELNVISNQLANFLRHRFGVEPGDAVAIILDRSEWMIVAMLAVLKAGSCFVPIEPDSPSARVADILLDAHSKATVDADTIAAFLLGREAFSGVDLNIPIVPGDVAYIIYTSGSTGKPKGVLTTHRSIINYNTWFVRRFAVTPKDSSVLLSSYAFSGVYTSVYGTLLVGGCLHIVPKIVLENADFLSGYIREKEISFLKITPSHLSLLVNYGGLLDGVMSGLRLIVIGGEMIKVNDLGPILQAMPDIQLIYHYGASETTMGSLTYEITAENLEQFVRRPRLKDLVSNVSVYVLNEELAMVPKGLAGILYIGGAGLSPGYLGANDQNREYFVDDPFEPGQKLFKTGDLGRWMEDGSLELLGRNDSQVKIRGYRIELAEIERAMIAMPGIERAAVLARKDRQGENVLTCYFVSGIQQTVRMLRNFLKSKLPEYMIPAFFVQMERFPVSATGKLDRKLFLDIPESAAMAASEYAAGKTRLEKRIISVWEDILKRKPIGLEDDFFESGGNSLKATMLVNRFSREFGVRITLQQVFNSRSVAAQALLLSNTARSSYFAINKADEAEDYVLSNGQRRLWTVSHIPEASIALNTTVAYTMKGPLDIEILTRSIGILIDRHEIIRTLFRTDGSGEPRQYVVPTREFDFRVNYTDLRKDVQPFESVKQLVGAAAIMLFDLARGPLIRVSVFRLTEDRFVFSAVLHHIVSDGWSMFILMKELAYVYNRLKVNGEVGLEPLRLQYRDYAVWHNELLSRKQLETERAYWLRQLSGELPEIRFQASGNRPLLQTYKGDLIRMEIPGQYLSGLRQIVNEKGGTLFTALLTIVDILLYKLTQQPDLIVGAPFAGREHFDLEDQIGFFVNLLPVRVRIEEEDTFLLLFDKVGKVVLEAIAHQLFPVDELIEELIDKRDYRHRRGKNSIFDVVVSLVTDHLSSGGEEYRLDGIEATNFEDSPSTVSRFDWLFNFAEAGEKLYLAVNYNSDIYSRPLAEKICSEFLFIMDLLLTNRDKPVSNLIYLHPSLHGDEPSVLMEVEDFEKFKF